MTQHWTHFVFCLLLQIVTGDNYILASYILVRIKLEHGNLYGLRNTVETGL